MLLSAIRWKHVPPIKFHSIWNVTEIGMSLKLECHSIWNVTQIEMSLKLECHSIGMPLKFECHSNLKAK